MAYLKYDGTTAAETPASVTNVYGTTAGNETLQGTSGAQGLYGQGDGDLLIGSGGGDTFYLQGSGTHVQESASQTAPAQIVAWQNTYLGDYSNIQNLSVGGSNTYAAGNAQNNVVVATGSGQELYGGAGQDVLVGNGQGDTFIVVKGEGNDAIYNFNASNDVVRLNAGYKTFAEVQSHMSQVGADVKIDLGSGDGVVLRNVNVGQLSAGNFQLGLDTSKLGAATFNENFDSLSLWNGSSSGTWSTTILQSDPKGNGGTLATNGEQQWYINSNYAGTASVKPWTVNNGELTITAAPATADISSQINGYKYTSGQVNTAHSFAQTYGYFEMRADIGDNSGGWPAFWLMPTDGSWPPELDVMETLTSNPNYDYTTAHSAASGSHTSAQGTNFVPDTQSGYHTYGVLWTKTDLVWYVDGVETFHTATPADMNKPMYMIANLALGGWGGNIDASQLPAEFKIDYMRAYGLADGSSTVTLDTAHTGGATYSSSSGVSAPAETANLVTGTSANDALTGPDGTYNKIRGLEGDDSIVGGTGFNDINGNQGHDTIVGHSQTGDWLLGGQAGDQIDASASIGHNTVNGNLGDDKIIGGSGGDILRGGQGADTIIGGAGADWISGDKGWNTVTGGGGADTFHGTVDGHTTITDFHQSEGDRIHIDAGTSYTYFQADDGVHVTVGGTGELILQNTQLNTLQSGWIFS